MKKYIITTLLGLSMFGMASAQEYKVNKASGKLVIELSQVTVEGYNGSEIIFKSTAQPEEVDPRAKGLRVINGDGKVDNTGLGISVTEEDNIVKVTQISSAPEIRIMVPKNILISAASHTVNAGKLEFKNLTNEINVTADYNPIELDNVTGPMTVASIYGDVEAKFTSAMKGAISIASTYAAVDVTIPAETKADVKLSTSYGEILASDRLKIVLTKNTKTDMISYGKALTGTINGGGEAFKLTSEYGKIYLRAAK